jgi:hypothetical protein
VLNNDESRPKAAPDLSSTSIPQPRPRRFSRADALDLREGWKRPPSDDEAPHPYWVDYDHHRVVCRGCPWFWARLGATRYELKAMGNRHRANMRQEAS